MEKICTKCGRTLPEEDFYWRDKKRGLRRSECKDCHNKYVKDKYQEKRNDIQILKQHYKCAKCGDSRSYVLDFHHIDPSQKDANISRLLSSNASLTNIKEEISKCVILCANCHREFHFLEKQKHISLQEYLQNINFNYSKSLVSPSDELQIEWKQKENIKEQKKYFCTECGKEITRQSKTGKCLQCAKKTNNSLLARLTREELKNKIRKKTFVEIGREYEISDNAVRKWCDKFNLPRTKKEINSYSEEEWKNI